MTVIAVPLDVLPGLDQIRRLRPELRLGQIFATAARLAEVATGANMWDVEDEEFLAAIERFADDLARSGGSPE